MDPTNLFDTQFVVSQIDPDGKKFDRGRFSWLSNMVLVASYVASSDLKS